MIDINNLSSFSVDKQFFTGVAKKVLKGENKERENLSFVFVNKKEIQKLNKSFRNKNKPTDVLSFELKLDEDNKKEYLGEVVICPEVVKENAKKHSVTLKEELTKVFIHGIMHLLGYDHEKSVKEAELMEKKEETYLLKLNLRK